MRKEVWKAIFSEGASSGTGFLAKMSGMSGLWEVGATVVAVAGVAVAAGLTGLLWNRVKRLTKESPEQAVPVESVESIFQVLSDEQNLVANDKLYDALAELENVYGTAEVDAKLNEAVAEWSRNRPEGAGNPPGRADMVKVLRTMVQGSHEAKYRELFAQYCRKLVSIEQTNVNYRPLIEDVSFNCVRSVPRIAETGGEVCWKGTTLMTTGTDLNSWTSVGRILTKLRICFVQLGIWSFLANRVRARAPCSGIWLRTVPNHTLNHLSCRYFCPFGK